ncbi:hypothetical protein [Tunicatimonas pelagia]|uniref:hypothetical protein n=1 Tax=Tunicatimonas pelagia TaxID=931531 RepID=UPI002666CC26|nr:hypothetical protein [Tunicatimonas pelagia]WKN43183.1 hypothetical protein P0M28_29510 [Tunicatimonas pelagia]
MTTSNTIKGFLFSLLLLSSKVTLHAQNSPGSPYTYFGVGDIYNKGSGHHLLKGGTGVADRSEVTINNLNPASYSSISNRFTFLHEFGVSLATATQNDGDNEGRQIALDFPYFMMAFKTGKKSGASVGLRKYSNVNYNIFGTGQFSGISGEYRVRYEGSGGLNEVYFGYGQALSKRLSIGAHVSYIFGNIENTQWVNSTDINYSIGIADNNYLRTFNWDVGVQYVLPIKNSSLTFGVTYDLENDLLSERDLLISEIDVQGSAFPDTLALEVLEGEEYILPNTLGFGISWNRNNRFKLSADVQTKLWSASTLEGQDYSLRDSRRASLGFEKLPNYQAKSYLGYITWGFGLYAEQSYLVLDGEGLNNSGFTAGFGLPIGNKGMLRFILERASRGQQLNDFFSESYTKLTMNITFMDLWFVRRKFE